MKYTTYLDFFSLPKRIQNIVPEEFNHVIVSENDALDFVLGIHGDSLKVIQLEKEIVLIY